MQAKLFDQFQIYCPPLDSSLVAAILLDIDPNTEPSKEQIDAIHSTLSELAAQADVSQLAQDLSDTAITDDTPSFTQGESITSISSSASLQQPFSTPLGFLQAALPHIQSAKLHHAFLDAGEDFDMWDIVTRILSEESIREMEERGLDGLDDNEELFLEGEWETVGQKKTPRSAVSEGRRKNKGNSRDKVVLVDIRQQQHARPSASDSTSSPRSLPAPDPWTQISSLSTHLASLLPSQQPSFFMAFFHSPEYPTPYRALVEALQATVKTYTTSEDYTPILIALLDILLPFYDDLDPEKRSRLVSDTELSLGATQGHADEALDLVHLLRDLDEDSTSGSLEMGIYHRPAASLAARSSETSQAGKVGSVLAGRSELPSGPPSVPPPPFLKGETSMQRSGNKPSPYQWQPVPSRKRRKTPHTHAAYIPAYTRDVNGIKVRGSGNGLGKGGRGDMGELTKFRKRIGDSMRRRDEMLREASRMWQKGNAKTRGGEVALYFAERARQFQEIARKDALEAARMMVETKRVSTQDRDTIDLHGTTVSEAIVIASETLASMECSSSKPLKIVTGRGAHSANQIGVLKPALRKALGEDGWSVSTWDGGLIVRGKRGRT